MRANKLHLKQHIPEFAREPLFQIVEHEIGNSYWHVKIKDAIVGDEPEFRLRLPRKRNNWPTPQRVANAGAGELNEARGLVSLTRYEDGIPVFSAQYASNGREVYCLWSTEEDLPSVRNGQIRLTPESSLASTAASLGRKGGQAKTEAKAQAARENGKKGGRPAKLTTSIAGIDGAN